MTNESKERKQNTRQDRSGKKKHMKLPCALPNVKNMQQQEAEVLLHKL